MATETTSDYAADLPPAMLEAATATADWLIILPVALCLLGAALMLMFRKSGTPMLFLSLLFLAAIGAMEAQLFMRVLAEGPVAMTMGKWLPPFGITFVADVLGVGFSLTSTFVTAIVLIYFQAEIVAREERHGFYSLILLLLGGVTGAFMTGDLFNLYVWFEVMLISSFGLMIIGGRKIQLDAAVKYGFLNFLATTFFLIGLGFLYGLLGTLNMADIARVSSGADPVAMTAIGGLFLLAFGMKAAAFPVNAWLPASYHTPDPAISALFGGLLTKVGAYALLRTMVLLIPTARENLDLVITIIAVATLLLGPLGAIAQTNLRRAVGFMVIGGIGSVLAGLSIVELRGTAGGALYAFSAMLVMTALYLVAGLLERVTGATDTRHMGGVYRAHSLLSVLFLILVFAVAGLPPFLGFWPKMLLIQGALQVGDNWIVAALLLNSILTTIAGSRLWAHIFWRDGREGPESETVNPNIKSFKPSEWRTSVAASVVLVAVIVGLGLQPNILFDAAGRAGFQLIEVAPYDEAVGLEVGE